MAIVKDRAGKYYNIDEETLRRFEVDPLDLPPGAAFAGAKPLSDAELDEIVGGQGYGPYNESVAGVRG